MRITQCASFQQQTAFGLHHSWNGHHGFRIASTTHPKYNGYHGSSFQNTAFGLLKETKSNQFDLDNNLKWNDDDAKNNNNDGNNYNDMSSQRIMNNDRNDTISTTHGRTVHVGEDGLPALMTLSASDSILAIDPSTIEVIPFSRLSEE